MPKFLALYRPGAIAAIAAVWLVSRTPRRLAVLASGGASEPG